MAKTETTVKGYVYTVTSPNGGTVTDAEGKLKKTVNAGDQVTVQAPSDALTCDDDDAVIYKVNFKAPLLALRLLGQGTNALPAGYTRLEFLGATGSQYIVTDYAPRAGCEIWADVQLQGRTDNPYSIFAAGKSAPSRVAVVIRSLTYATYFGGAKSVSTSYARRMFHIAPNGLMTVGSTSIQLPVTGTEANTPLYLFANVDKTNFWNGYIFSVKIKDSASIYLIPALDPTGTPCMFDLVSKHPFRNAGTGSFIAGVGTVAQLPALLRNLPATGGALTLSLPAEANTPEVAEQLQACHDTKGWTLTVHEYRPAEASTYSLRRVRSVVWCSPSPCEHGSYVDNFGTRWHIDRCAAIFGRLGQDPAAYGYTPFDSVEQAAEHWALQPYVDPEAMDDIMGDNGTLEQGGTENTSPTTNS